MPTKKIAIAVGTGDRVKQKYRSLPDGSYAPVVLAQQLLQIEDTYHAATGAVADALAVPVGHLISIHVSTAVYWHNQEAGFVLDATTGIYAGQQQPPPTIVTTEGYIHFVRATADGRITIVDYGEA